MSISASTMVLARALLDRARVIAEAPAAGIGALGSGHPTGKPPPGIALTRRGVLVTDRSTLDVFGERINGAIATGQDELVKAAIKLCVRELDALLKGKPGRNAETREQFKYRVIETYEGITAPQAARRENCSESLVRKFRFEDGREGRYGRKVKAGEAPE